MLKIDYKKKFKAPYTPSAKTVAEVDVPKMNFLMIDGEGDPNTSQSFQDAVATLYPLSYTLMVKKGPIGFGLRCYATGRVMVGG